MKLIINLDDGWDDIKAEIKVDKAGFARIEELANSLALSKLQHRPTKRVKEKGEWVRLADSIFPKRRR